MPAADPGDLRATFVRYVRALHDAYLSAAGPEAASLPLADGPFAVAVVAGAQLHLIATRDPLPPVRAHEQVVDDEAGPLRWQVRFLDASVVPQLAGPDVTDVLAVLGVRASLYHLIVGVDASLSGHQAMHAGTGLAHAHRRRDEPTR